MRTTLDFPDELFRELKTRAAMEGTTLRELIPRLVRGGLGAASGVEIRRTPSRLPAPVRGGRKMKAFTNAELAALADSLTEDDLAGR